MATASAELQDKLKRWRDRTEGVVAAAPPPLPPLPPPPPPAPVALEGQPVPSATEPPKLRAAGDTWLEVRRVRGSTPQTLA